MIDPLYLVAAVKKCPIFVVGSLQWAEWINNYLETLESRREAAYCFKDKAKQLRNEFEKTLHLITAQMVTIQKECQHEVVKQHQRGTVENDSREECLICGKWIN